MLRHFESVLNDLIRVADVGLKTLSGQYGTDASRHDLPSESNLTQGEQKSSVSLMRVNHTGEVCAQALYEGQALAARSESVKQSLRDAAEEERAHLSWLHHRLVELNGKTSVLDPLFFAGSLGIGFVSGLLGDKVSLGFVEATEDQVCQHLDRHLSLLPKPDKRSQSILTKIREEEVKHGDTALARGGQPYPDWVRTVMTLASRVMTETTKRI